ncbi:MAG: hypothetical protein J7J11_01775 [Desulfurococcales archaeon]|nr:hypothetical protein [Desulfurococcales archaeon]
MLRWRSGRKLTSMMRRLDSIIALLAVREVYSYKDLSNILGISVPTLSKYGQGEIIPSEEKAVAILNKLLDKKVVKDFMCRLISKYDSDLLRILGKPILIEYIGMYLCNRIVEVLAGSKIDAIIAPSDYSLPLASIIAFRLGVFTIPLITWPQVAGSDEVRESLRKLLRIKRELSVISVHVVFSKDDALALKNIIEQHRFKLRLVEALLLADMPLSADILQKGMLVESILP